MPSLFNPSFDFLHLNDEEINKIFKEHRLTLSRDEAKKIQSLLNRPPTLAECVLWSIQGSEHCSYKSTRPYLKNLPNNAPNVILGPREDAGIVEVARDKAEHRYGIVMSHESHNHPSQIVPYEGAATGVGGNVRDVSCMGAEVIAVADSLRFGDISKAKTKWIDEGVVAGIAGYGNPIGVPNLTGDVYYDKAYQDNCLVTVVTLGIVRDDQVIHSYAPENAEGYQLILVGKPTDNSGFGGASFASLDLNEEEAEQNKGAVQEPNAFLGRHLLKANLSLFKKLAAKNLINQVGFKDLGAGGIACASVELADGAHYGAEVKLEHVHTSLDHLPPQVILCAETQERYMWVVPPNLVDMILTHYNEEWQLPVVSRGAQATVIGQIRADGQYLVTYHGETIIFAKAADITKGIVYNRPHYRAEPAEKLDTPTTSSSLRDRLLALLANENSASRKPIEECYDKQVQGRIVLQRGDAQAGVLMPFNSTDYPAEIRNVGVALAISHHPPFGKQDAYWTAYNAVVSSMRKVVAVGAKPAALTDCLCFGNPENPERMEEIIQAINGIADAANHVPLYDYPGFATPVISGNVSLYNESEQGAIPASPIISCLGVLEDIQFLTTPDFKKTDSILLSVGHFSTDTLPKPNGQEVFKEISTVITLIRDNLILSCNVSDVWGPGYGLITMGFKNQIGFRLNFTEELSRVLFSANSAFLLEISPTQIDLVQSILEQNKIKFSILGTTIKEPLFIINANTTLTIDEAYQLYSTSLRELRA